MLLFHDVVMSRDSEYKEPITSIMEGAVHGPISITSLLVEINISRDCGWRIRGRNNLEIY